MHRLHVILLALASALAPAGASAQAYPSKPVRVVVGLAPGGGTDIVARSGDGPLGSARAELSSGRPFSLDATLKSIETTYLDAAIEVAQGNMSQAAKLLGISRSTLYSRLEAAGRAGAKLANHNIADTANSTDVRD